MKARNALCAVLIVGLFSLSALAADITGVWKGEMTDPQGTKHPISFNLKVDGNTLTGTITHDSENGEKTETIENGKINGNQVSFEVKSKSPEGDVLKITLTAKVDGDQMKGEIAPPQGRSFPFAARKGQGPALPTATNKPAPSADIAKLPPPNPKGTDPVPEDAQKAILALFDKYALVGGFSPAHGDKDIDDFVLNLIRNPALPDRINDIAVEGGNSLYQPILDRYIAGENVPLTEVRQVWRNTTQPNCGFSAFYEQLFPLVRRINEKLPKGRRLRVLACDPPVDWSKIKSVEDLRPFLDRGRSIASVIEKEILAKHQKALLLFGTAHVRHGGGAARRYEKEHPNAAFIIAGHRGFGNDVPALGKYNAELEKRVASWPVPSLVTIQGTWLADLNSAYFSAGPGEREGRSRGFRGIDGYLYLGPRDLLLRQPIPANIALDKEYMGELRRRAAVLGAPPDAPMYPEVIVERESRYGGFFYDAAENAKRLKMETNKEPSRDGAKGRGRR